jgi:hypothetical protein
MNETYAKVSKISNTGQKKEVVLGREKNAEWQNSKWALIQMPACRGANCQATKP